MILLQTDCGHVPSIAVDTPKDRSFSGVYEKLSDFCNGAFVYKKKGTNRILSKAANGYWWLTIADYACKSNGYVYVNDPNMQCPGDAPDAKLRRGGSNADVSGTITETRSMFIKNLFESIYFNFLLVCAIMRTSKFIRNSEIDELKMNDVLLKNITTY